MKSIKSILLLIILFSGLKGYTQTAGFTAGDTAISFKVYGACISCKIRIEKALKLKGIKSANWDEETNMLALVYNPSKI